MKSFATLVIIAGLIALPARFAAAQAGIDGQSFDKIEIFEPVGDSVRESDVRVNFGGDAMEIVSRKSGAAIKRFTYKEIRSAEYSYTKNPRWKTGLGLGAAGLLFPPLFLVALPLGFSKHRRHWITIKTEDDFAVLKLSKSNRKFFIPTFETRTNVRIAAVGDDK